MTRRGNGIRWIGTLAIVVATLMAISAYAGAVQIRPDSGSSSESTGIASSPITGASSQPSASSLVASGPMVSLGIRSEVGTSLGGVLTPSASPPMGQNDLIVVTLPLQNQPQLNAFLAAVSDPGSPQYAHFLTSAQFARSYGPPLNDQLGVAKYLASKGLTVEYVSSDHLTVAAQGTLQQLERAFAVSFGLYTAHGQSFFAPASSPSVPESLVPWIQDVVGLTNFNFGFVPEVLFNSHLATHPSASNGPGVGVMDYPNQMTYEYQLNQLWNATGNASAGTQPSFPHGVTIATGLWDTNTSAYCPYSMTDILQFFHGNTTAAPSMPSELPAPTDRANYNVTGAQTYGPGTGNCTAGISGVGPNTATEELDFEMTIDQEYSGEDAPGAVIEPTYVGGLGVTNGVNESNLELLLAWLAAGNVPNLNALSLSFGGGESNDFETYFTELAAEGVTVSASSGDDNGACGPGGPTLCSGNAVCDTGSPPTQYSYDTEGTPTVDYPGSSPNVLSVGGTANVAYGAPGSPGAILPGQTVWNWCPTFDSGTSGGSTGGVSSIFTEPAFQSAVPIVNRAMEWATNVTNTGNFTNGAPPTGCLGCSDGDAASPTARAVPDIAGPAADMTGYMAESWVTGFGGTSFSSPSVAGMVGSIIAFDGHPLGLIDPALYQLEQGYLNGSFAGLPFPVAPTYFVQNYSNAFFNGSTDYNTSSGWGVPQAYNIALLLGKPFLSTNPTGPAMVGNPYPVAASIKDDRSVSSVRVTYLEPGGKWGNASLSLASGTANSGTWTGDIPAPTQTGVLEYCVDAVDSGTGNSWSPYNQSAWVATDGKNTTPGAFGCTVPFQVGVHPATSPEYTVTFSESGLPTGFDWKVTVDGVLKSERTVTGGTVQLKWKDLPDGTYSYSITALSGWHQGTVPYSGTVTVNGASVDTEVVYSPVTYEVEFSERGLPSGLAWQATVNGGTQSLHTTGGTDSLTWTGLANGSYSYSVAANSGWHESTLTYSGSLTVKGGTDAIDGSGVGHAVTLVYKEVTYSVTFSESGLPSGETWKVTFNGGTMHLTTDGGTDSLTWLHVANGTYGYSIKNVPGYTTTFPSSGTVVIDGAPLQQTVTYT
jgi:hypothetical protein